LPCRPEKIELSETMPELARKAFRVAGAAMGGVDLLPTLDGQVYVIEVNSSPGFRALEQATGKDVAGRTIDFAVHGEW
jgi:ribosomal protein S6--L-glutamate ligase